jgi:hypothetical protein
VDPKATLVLQDERSSSILMADGELTAVAPSPARTSPRLIDPLLILLDGLLSPSSTPNLLAAASSNYHMLLVLQSLFLYSLIPTEPQAAHLMNSSKSSTRTLISDQVSSSRSSTLPSPFTSKPPRTATLPTKTSPGRNPRSSSFKHRLEVIISEGLNVLHTRFRWLTSVVLMTSSSSN